MEGYSSLSKHEALYTQKGLTLQLPIYELTEIRVCALIYTQLH